EHLLGKEEATGSIPVNGSSIKRASLSRGPFVALCRLPLPVTLERFYDFAEHTICVGRRGLTRAGADVAAAAVFCHHVADRGLAVALEDVVADLDRYELVVATVCNANRHIRGWKQVVNEVAIAARKIFEAAHIGDYDVAVLP